MVQYTISGESIEEIDEKSAELREAENLVEGELLDVHKKVVEVKETLKDMTENGSSVRRNVIEDEVGYTAYHELQLLQYHGYAASGGQGGNWRYSGE